MNVFQIIFVFPFTRKCYVFTVLYTKIHRKKMKIISHLDPQPMDNSRSVHRTSE